MNKSQKKRVQLQDRRLKDLQQRRENFLARLREIDRAITTLESKQERAAA